MESAVWGLIGTIVGALASIATAWLTSKSSESIHQQKLQAERIERASAFQRQNLLELQDALYDALRLVSRGHMEEMLAANRGEPWQQIKIPAELDEQIRLEYRKVLILTERVADDWLRNEIKNLMSQSVVLLDSPSAAEAIRQVETVNASAVEVFQNIGAVLRKYFHSAR